MKRKKKFKHLPRTIILIVLVCVVAVSTSLTVNSQKQIREHHTDEVLLVIDGLRNEFLSADENSRDYKINAFNALSDYQVLLSKHVLHSDRIDSEFKIVLNQIVDWFYSDYLSIIDEIAEAAEGDTVEIRQYLSKLSADIDRISESFNYGNDYDPADEDAIENDPVETDLEDEDPDDNEAIENDPEDEDSVENDPVGDDPDDPADEDTADNDTNENDPEDEDTADNDAIETDPEDEDTADNDAIEADPEDEDSINNDPGDVPDDDPQVDRSHNAELFAELYDMYAAFTDDAVISLRIGANEARINELTALVNMIEDERIIDTERISGLYNKIDSLIDLYAQTDQSIIIEADSILYKFETELSLQAKWFENHYSWLVNEIMNTDREDEYDDTTVIKQLNDLELLKQHINNEGAVNDEFLLSINEQIDQLIEEYESDLASITELIRERIAEAARVAVANNRAEANNTASNNSNANTNSAGNTNNNRTGTSNSNANSNTSGSNSGSSNTASSGGTQNQSGSGNQTNSGTASVSGNNNYPSITSNCREILARVIKLEAPNGTADEKQAIAEVVMNRMVSSRWDHVSTVEGVVFDDKWGVQFTVRDLIWTDRGSPSSSDYAAADRALGGSNILSRSYVFFNTRPVTQNDIIWIGAHAFSK